MQTLPCLPGCDAFYRRYISLLESPAVFPTTLRRRRGIGVGGVRPAKGAKPEVQKQGLVSMKITIEVVEGKQRRRGRSRQRGGGGGAPAGAACWEQVRYLGQHIASSAFLQTCTEQTSNWLGRRRCIIKRLRRATPAARRMAGRRRRSRITPPPINRTGRCVSLGAIMSPGQFLALLRIQVYPPLCWLA